MNHVKQGPHFKPYTGQDYEQFKKNYGFGGGYLGFDFDNPNFKEKVHHFLLTKISNTYIHFQFRVINYLKQKNMHNKLKIVIKRN
jgi:hypothetical protein